jgi:hypothetical protein
MAFDPTLFFLNLLLIEEAELISSKVRCFVIRRIVFISLIKLFCNKNVTFIMFRILLILLSI